MKILKDLRDKLEGLASAFRAKVGEVIDAIMPDANIYLDELKERQPIGKPDPIAQFWDQREERPSLRHGLIPIEKGWHRPVIEKNPDGARIVIRSGSWHLQFFTMMTGREYLGTKVTQSQIPTGGKKTLYFWSQRDNGQVWPRVSDAPGFTPQTDFVKDAVDAANARTHRDISDRIRVIVPEKIREGLE